MKKLFVCAVLFALSIILPLQVSSTCLYANEKSTSTNGISEESIRQVLNTDLGNKMVGLVEDLGGNIGNIDDSKSIILPNIEASLIPAGQTGKNKIGLLYVDFKNIGQFLFAVETPLDPLDFKNASLKLYTPSGKIITFSNFNLKTENAKFYFQKFDDINNSIHITDSSTCTILLILGILVLWPLLIVWAVKCG